MIGLMLLTPLPGVRGEQLLAELRSIHRDAVNLRGGGGRGGAHGRLTSYIEWATNADLHLSRLIPAAEVGRLVLTPGYDRLLSGVGSLTAEDIGTQRVVNGLVSLELDQRVSAFEAAIGALEAQIRAWSGPEVFVVADTSVYIQHESKLEVLDFRPLLQIRTEPVRLLVPIVVIDELDSLKNMRSGHVRWRAGYTLAVLDKAFAESTGPSRLVQDFPVESWGGIPRGGTVVEVLFDPPGHVRLPIADDEIVDRALAVQVLAGREVTLLTFDTGMSLQARQAGLRAEKLSTPVEDGPAKAMR